MKAVFKAVYVICILCFVNCLSNGQVYQSWVQSFNGQDSSWGKTTGIVTDNSGNVYITGYSRISGLSFEYDYVTIKYNSMGIQQWISTYDGAAGRWDKTAAIVIDGSKNIFVTGYTFSGATNDDYTTIKYDSNGTQKWVAKYERPQSDDEPTAMAIDSFGNVYVTGYSNYGSSEGNYCTIKYDSNGIQKWIAEYSGSANDWDIPYSIAVDLLGNVYVTGFIREGSPSREIYCTIKYNTNGAQLWVKKYNSNSNETGIANSLSLDNNGNVIVTGKFTNSSNHSFDYLTIKYDSAGIQKWTAMYDCPQHASDNAIAVICDSDGSILVTGSSYYDYLTINYDSNGVQKWTARYNATDDQPASMKLDINHNVYITGVSYGTMEDYATLKYNSFGVQQWVMTFNGPNNLGDNATSLALDNQGNVFVTGWSSVSSVTNNFVTIKYSQPIGIKTITEKVPEKFSLNQNYPNPFNPSTKIKFDVAAEMTNSGRNVNLTVYNVLGEEIAVLVNEDLKPGTYEVDWDASNRSGGIYFARLTAGEYRETIKMVLVK